MNEEERIKDRGIMDKTSWELQERHKELTCVYTVSEILEKKGD